MPNQGDVDVPPERLGADSGPVVFGNPGGKPRSLLGILLTGIILLGAAGGWFLATRVAAPPAIAKVSSEEIPEAITTLGPQASQQARSDPRECRIPMGFIVAATPGNPAGGTVRFRTSGYESPPFVITDKPQRIAIPNPMPEGGVGLLSVDGEAKGLVVALTPPASMEPVNGTATTRVIFPVSPPCKS
jgi:hypothetical protein